ncbi:Gem (Nuclear organelle) associated protein 6 [Podila verticillata]|nr:Gem (Nuclear organelle) associated protein 6 [Podila verticillata]
MADDWRFFGNSLRDVYSHLGSTCHVMLKSGKVYSGHLYNVDPETSTLLLIQDSSEDKEGKVDSQDYKTVVAIRQHAVKDFSIDKSPVGRKLTVEDMDTLVPISASLASPESIHSRKAQLVELLRSTRIPVETTDEDPVVHILNSAHVRPPYLPSSVDCLNPVIRERVKAIIQEQNMQ